MIMQAFKMPPRLAAITSPIANLRERISDLGDGELLALAATLAGVHREIEAERQRRRAPSGHRRRP